jgi:hypothetical protein
MWTRPPTTSFATVNLERPATAREGAFVPQLWAKIADPDPRDLNPHVRDRDDTTTSRNAPDWISSTNRFPVGPLNEWDYITASVRAGMASIATSRL